MEIPEWHTVSYDAAEVVNLRTIAAMPGSPDYAALRSYATGRREHRVLGPMPAPVTRIANRRLWLTVEVREWLTIPLPQWRRSKWAIQQWIEAGRPRYCSVDFDPATMPVDDGRSPATP